KITAYGRVFVAAETQRTDAPMLTNQMISGLRSVLQNGGKVCISGSDIYSNLKSGNNRSRSFLSDVLGIQDFGTRSARGGLGSADGRFLPTTATLQLSPTVTTW